MGKHIYPIITVIFISIIVGVFINSIISNKPESKQSLGPYEQEQQEMIYEVDDNIMDSAHDMCSGEVVEEDCVTALQDCLANTKCREMVNKYMFDNNLSKPSREVIIQASKARMDNHRKELGLPYEEW